MMDCRVTLGNAGHDWKHPCHPGCMPGGLLGEYILHVDAEMGGAVRQEGTEGQRVQPVRLSAVLA